MGNHRIYFLFTPHALRWKSERNALSEIPIKILISQNNVDLNFICHLKNFFRHRKRVLKKSFEKEFVSISSIKIRPPLNIFFKKRPKNFRSNRSLVFYNINILVFHIFKISTILCPNCILIIKIPKRGFLENS